MIALSPPAGIPSVLGLPPLPVEAAAGSATGFTAAWQRAIGPVPPALFKLSFAPAPKTAPKTVADSPDSFPAPPLAGVPLPVFPPPVLPPAAKRDVSPLEPPAALPPGPANVLEFVPAAAGAPALPAVTRLGVGEWAAPPAAAAEELQTIPPPSTHHASHPVAPDALAFQPALPRPLPPSPKNPGAAAQGVDAPARPGLLATPVERAGAATLASSAPPRLEARPEPARALPFVPAPAPASVADTPATQSPSGKRAEASPGDEFGTGQPAASADRDRPTSFFPAPLPSTVAPSFAAALPREHGRLPIPLPVAPRQETSQSCSPSIAAQTTGPQKTGPQRIRPQEIGAREIDPQGIAPQRTGPQIIGPQIIGPQGIGAQETGPQGSAPQRIVPQRTAPPIIGPQMIRPQETAPQRMGPQGIGARETSPQGIAPQRTGPEIVSPQIIGPQEPARRKAGPSELAFSGVLSTGEWDSSGQDPLSRPAADLSESTLPRTNVPGTPAAARAPQVMAAGAEVAFRRRSDLAAPVSGDPAPSSGTFEEPASSPPRANRAGLPPEVLVASPPAPATPGSGPRRADGMEPPVRLAGAPPQDRPPAAVRPDHDGEEPRSAGNRRGANASQAPLPPATAGRPEEFPRPAPLVSPAPQRDSADAGTSAPPPVARWRASETALPEPARPAPAAREIKLQWNGVERLELRLVERGGDVHVAVRTADARLADALREDLPALSAQLERHGFRAGNWHTGAAEAPTRPSAADTAPGGNAHDPQSRSGPQPDGREQHQRHPAHAPDRKNDGKDFAWLFTSLR